MKLKPVENSQLPVERAIFNSSWQIMKKYYNIKQASNEEIWQDILKEIEALYGLGIDKATTKLSRNMAMNILNYLELLNSDTSEE